MSDAEAVEAFKEAHYLNDEDLVALQAIKVPAERIIQDYRSTYNDIRDWLRQQKTAGEKEASILDWDDVVFEVDLLKSQEINLDYILELIFEHNKKNKNKIKLIDEVRLENENVWLTQKMMAELFQTTPQKRFIRVPMLKKILWP